MSAIDRLIEYLDRRAEWYETLETMPHKSIVNACRFDEFNEIKSVAKRFAHEEQLQKASGKLGLTDVVSDYE